MPNTYTYISKVTVAGATATYMDFTNIPQTYTDLLFQINVRSSRNGNNGFPTVIFNSTSTGYSTRHMYGTGNNQQAAFTDNSAAYGYCSSAPFLANTFGGGELYIPNYTSNTNKPFNFDSCSENSSGSVDQYVLDASQMLWSNTAAITSVRFQNLSTSDSFVQYSEIVLYGIKNS
jgi:hypothetical protein